MDTHTINLIDDLVGSQLFRTLPGFAKIAQELVSPPTVTPVASTEETYRSTAAKIQSLPGNDAVTMGLKKLYQIGLNGRIVPLSTKLAPILMDNHILTPEELKAYWPDVAIATMADLKDDPELNGILGPVKLLLDRYSSPINRADSHVSYSGSDIEMLATLSQTAPDDFKVEFKKLATPQEVKSGLKMISDSMASPVEVEAPSQDLDVIGVARKTTQMAVDQVVQIENKIRNQTAGAARSFIQSTVVELSEYFDGLKLGDPRLQHWDDLVGEVAQFYVWMTADMAAQGIHSDQEKITRIHEGATKLFGGLSQSNSGFGIGESWPSLFDSIEKAVAKWRGENIYGRPNPQTYREIYEALKPMVVKAIKESAEKTNNQQFGDYVISHLEQPWAINQFFTSQSLKNWYGKASTGPIVNAGTAMWVATLIKRIHGSGNIEPGVAAKWLFDQVASERHHSQNARLPQGQSTMPPSGKSKNPNGDESASKPNEPEVNLAEYILDDWLTPEVIAVSCALLFHLSLNSNRQGYNFM